MNEIKNYSNIDIISLYKKLCILKLEMQEADKTSSENLLSFKFIKQVESIIDSCKKMILAPNFLNNAGVSEEDQKKIVEKLK